MSASTHNVPPFRSGPSPRRMRVRKAANVWRIVVGLAVFASAPWSGAWALLGLLPIAWATTSIWLISRGQGSSQN
jgi:hypothetical protein